MNQIYQLQSILNFFLWVTIVLLAASCILISYVALGGELFEIKVADRMVEYFTVELVVSMLLGIAGHITFIMALFALRRLVRHFIARQFFAAGTISLLKKTGQLLFITGVLTYIPQYLLPLFSSSHIKIALSADHESFLFLIVISLFFFTLSSVFDEARKIKEENELTV